MSAATQFRGVMPWRQTYWDWRAAGNFIGGGTGSGVLIAAAAAALAGLAPVSLSALLGIACVGAGLTCVWLEIGRPWRALNVFLNAKTSWMTREALVAPPLMLAGGLAVLTGSVWALVLAALLACAFLFCQARILHAAKGIPAWRQCEVVPLIIATGLVEGCGLFLVLAAIVAPQAAPLVSALLLVALAARWLVLQRYARRIAEGALPRAAAREVVEVLPLVRVAGHLVPAVFVALGLLISPSGLGALLCAIGGVAAAGAGWAFKLTLILKAAYTQGYSVPHTPTRGAAKPGAGGKPGW